ncbi:MAG: hypothetical protein IIV41_11320 [Akkermansia sp.]|nr:hypothetical protein [Akkermansia sp.]
MKRFVICLGVLGTAAAGWPELRPDTYRQQVEFKYPEPLVSQTTVQNGWKHKDTRLSDKDLGRDFFTITGDEQHKPIPVWSDQDTLDISFSVGTSCATEYRFRLNPGTCYLGGAAAPQEEVVFRCPPDSLSGEAFMDDRGVGVVVHARAQITRESRELSAESGVRFVFREAIFHRRTGEVSYRDRVEAVQEPALLKHLRDSGSLDILEDRGEDVWKKLTPDSPLPGHVLVRPVKPLASGKLWHLLVEPGRNPGFSTSGPVCSDVMFAEELPSGVEWVLHENKSYRLRVSFGAEMNAAEMPALFQRMQLAVGDQVAADAGEGVKELVLNGSRYEFRYAGVQELPPVHAYGRRRGGEPLLYHPQNRTRGFWVEVSAPAPAVLDVVLPADTASYLGWKMVRAHRHRMALNPAMPVLEYGETTLLPVKGERVLRLPFANLEAVKVSAWRLQPEKMELAMKGNLVNSVQLRQHKLRYELLKDRQWKGLSVPEGSVADMQKSMERMLRTEKLRAEHSRQVLAGAEALPGAVVKTGADGMLQSGECLLRLDDAVGGSPAPGMYLLRLQPLAGAAVREAMSMNGQEPDLLDAQVDVLVQVTDLNVMAGEGAVLVNRYSDGEPLESGELTYQTTAGEQCRIAVENGVAWLPGDFRAKGALRVSCGEDAVLVKDAPRGRRAGTNRRGYSTLLVLDRPLYRPGDTVHVRGVLRRQLPDGSCDLPMEKSARVTISRPDGKMLEKREVSLGEFGAFEMSFTLPEGEDDVTGYYALQVESGKFRQRGTVNCQVFRRDAFKVNLELELEPVAPSHYTVRVAAQDYSGVPLAGAACSLNIGGQSRTLELDAAGKAEITGEVTEEMRKAQGLSVRGSVSNDREEYVQVPPVHKPIYPADFYMTVQGGRLRLMDSCGSGVLKREQVVELKLVRTARDPEVGANGLGTMQSREQVLWSGSLTVPADCQTGQEMPLELLQKHSGAEAWKLSGRDAAGRETTLSYPIWRFQPDSLAPGLQVEHKDGELVLQADLPRAVKAHLFIGCGQKLRHQVLPVVAGPQTLRVPLQPGEEGNVCATLVLPGRLADEAPIVISEQCYVPVARYHLGVELQLPQQVCRPAETVSLSGRVLADGKPAEAEVTLYAVDAGMLSVGHYQCPDPESYFCRGSVAYSFSLPYSPMRNNRAKGEIILTLLPGLWQGDMVGEGCNLYIDEPPSVIVSAAGAPVQGRYYKRAASKNAAMAVDREMSEEVGFGGDLGACGGGLGAPAAMVAGAGAEQAAMPRLRTDFAPVALWKGALRTDAEGRFSAQVTLPDTLTTYRVFAVALDKSGKRFGSASGDFTVAQPVMLTPGTPLFMSLGDTLRLPLSIVNNTDEPGTWRVTLQGAGAPQEITLEARQSGTLYFDFSATAEGGQKLRWMAQGKPGSDAVQGEFTVRFPAPVLKEVHRLALSPGAAAVALAPLMGSDVAAASRGQMQLVASANPLLHLAGAADFLLAYPYGCTEQRASALIPWLLYQHLAPFCPLMAQTPAEEVKETVEEMVQEILSRQCEDGGLSYWGGRRESCLWASAHAAYVLKLAQEQGFNVPQEQLDELIHYLSKADDDQLSVLARFCIARVRGRSGAMMDALREAPLPGSWARETRASMQFMLAMLENPAGADAAFRKWMRTAGRDYRHGSTQTHAWSLLALAEYIKLSRKSGGEAVLVLHDGAELQLGMGATEVPLPWQPGQEMKALPITLAAKQGTVYATLSLRALPRTSDYPGVTERGLQVTRLYETKGADGIWRPATCFKVGDVVRVTLTCAKVAPELKYLVLEDYLPACMEAINPAVPGQAAGLESLEWSYWFDHREYLADRVRGFCTRWAGRDLLNMRYYARVKRAGSSTAPPAQAQLMYEPQVYGLSPNARVVSEP